MSFRVRVKPINNSWFKGHTFTELWHWLPHSQKRRQWCLWLEICYHFHLSRVCCLYRLYCLSDHRKDPRGAESKLLKEELRVTSHYIVKFREQPENEVSIGKWQREFKINERLVLLGKAGLRQRPSGWGEGCAWSNLSCSLLAGAMWQSGRNDPGICKVWLFLKAVMKLVEIIDHRVDGRWASNLNSYFNIDYLFVFPRR